MAQVYTDAALVAAYNGTGPVGELTPILKGTGTTTAFFSAIDAALPAEGGTVFLLPGDYTCGDGEAVAVISQADTRWIASPGAIFSFADSTGSASPAALLRITQSGVHWSGGTFVDDRASGWGSGDSLVDLVGNNVTFSDATIQITPTAAIGTDLNGVTFRGTLPTARAEGCTIANNRFLVNASSDESAAYESNGFTPRGYSCIKLQNAYYSRVVGNRVTHPEGGDTLGYVRCFVYNIQTEHTLIESNFGRFLQCQLSEAVSPKATRPESQRSAWIEDHMEDLTVGAGTVSLESHHLRITGNEWHEIGCDYGILCRGTNFTKIDSNDFGRFVSTRAVIRVKPKISGQAGGSGLQVSGNMFHNINGGSSWPQPKGVAVWLETCNGVYISDNHHTLLNGSLSDPRYLYVFDNGCRSVRVGDWHAEGNSGAIAQAPYWFKGTGTRQEVSILRNDVSY